MTKHVDLQHIVTDASVTKYSRVFLERTEFACMQILAKIVDFAFANRKSLN